MSKFAWVSPGYFDTMKIRLIMGRDFNPGDTSGSQRVAVVNQTFVRRYLGNANPIGQTLRTGQEPGYPSTLYQVVGVITDTKYNDIRGETPPMAFAPAPQNPDPRPFAVMLVHSNAKEAEVASAIKRAMARNHPEVVATAGDFQAGIRDGLVRERVMAVLSGIFGFIAALLAIIGLYGVISCLVVSRRPEIGVRMALGADRWQVIGMIMKEALSLLFIGTLAGAALSLIAGRSAASLLFGLKPYDPLTLVAASLLLAVISILASFLPARRASTLDPMIALRYE
jgi:predicted permease